MKWEDPPESRSGPGQQGSWQEEAAQLKANPGRWAVLAEYGDKVRAYNLANQIKHGKLRAFRPQGDFEAAARRIAGTGRTRLYARYIGRGTT